MLQLLSVERDVLIYETDPFIKDDMEATWQDLK